ncbi:MAG: hypothetical protein HY343_07910 [Lentisphaerae bacterium]|nr:hypothetical protein [Lentisphaerota bacterium]
MAGLAENNILKRAAARLGRPHGPAWGVIMSAFLAGSLWAETSEPPWQVNATPVRFFLQKNEKSPWPAEVGTAAICGLFPTGGLIGVVTRGGKAVPSKVLWAAEGEPLKILFDTSDHEQAYDVVVGLEPASNAVPDWEPRAGLVLETRDYAEWPLDTLAQMQDAWGKGRQVFGRSLVPKIFDGIHHHGPSQNFMGRYTGAFWVGNAGAYAFATLSDNSSFLLIDGKPVAEWPGTHNLHGGRRGEHHGQAQLQAGTHSLEYFCVQKAAPAVAAVAWKRPGQDRFEIMRESAFVPVAGFHAADWASAPGGTMAAYFEWTMVEHASAADSTLVTAEFRAIPLDKDSVYRWNFDDGATATGAVARHVFLCPGLRSVRLEVTDKNHRVSSVEQKVRIHSRWLQVEECPRVVVERQKAELAACNLSALPVRDLRAAAIFAAAEQERVWLVQLGDACLKRKAEFGPDTAGLFALLAGNYEHPDVRALDRALQAYRTAIELKPPDRKLEARTRLQMAGLLIHGLADAGQAAELLRLLDAAQLDEHGKRLQRIYLADIMLAQGDAGQAQEVYLQIGGTAGMADVRQALKQTVRLEMALNYITREEFDGAYGILKALEWEIPVKRLSTQTGFALIVTHLCRKEYPRALARCRLLAQAGLTGENQAHLLYLTAETYTDMGQTTQALEVCRQLISEFPNTEFAARAKDKMEKR